MNHTHREKKVIKIKVELVKFNNRKTKVQLKTQILSFKNVIKETNNYLI